MNNKLNLRLIKIEEDIKDIKDGIRRNDTHISFITRIYFIMKLPMIKILKYFGHNIEDNNYNDINNYFYIKKMEKIV